MSYKDKMLKLRQTQPQGGTVEGRSKEDQAKFKRLESSVAYPESDVDTGITETPGNLGEIAYPQSDRMDAEEALLNKLAVATKGNETKTKPNVVGVGKPKTKITDTKTKRHNYAPHTGSKTRGPHGPKGPRLDSLDDYEGKQKDEYYPVAKNVIPPENYAGFTEDEAAQMSFSQSAAAKSLKDSTANRNLSLKRKPYLTETESIQLFFVTEVSITLILRPITITYNLVM